MSEHEAFVERVVAHLPKAPPTADTFAHWSHANRPTEEGFALIPVAGADPAKVLAAVMDVGHYQGNIDFVTECRAISDSRFPAPDHVRFYQRISLPMLGAVHHELVLHRMGERAGYQIAAWDVLRGETDALSVKQGFRSDYNHGAWFVAPGVVGYALGSAPKREDVGFLKWKALTAGADAAAGAVLKANIQAMARWATRR